MKFIQVIEQFPLPIPIYAKEDYTQWPLDCLIGEGITCEVVTIKHSGQKKSELVNGILVRRFPNVLLAILYLLSSRNILVHTHGKNILSLVCGFLPCKKTITPHGFSETKGIKRILFNILIRLFDKVFTVTDVERDNFIKCGVPSQRIIKLGYIIDFDFFRKKPNVLQVRRRYNIKKREKCITFIGNVRKVKNLPTLLRAFYYLISRGYKYKLIIIGEFTEISEKSLVHQFIKDFNLQDHILITGYLNHKGVRDILHITNVFVNTSFYEGLALTAQEAAAAGVPLCLSDIPSFRSHFAGNAKYHPPADAKQLAKNIYSYIKNNNTTSLHVKNNRELTKKVNDENTIKTIFKNTILRLLEH